MNALEQAQHFLNKAQYANFFKLMHKNLHQNTATSAVLYQLKDLEDRFIAGETNRHFAQQLDIFFQQQKQYITMPLPDAEKKEDTIFLTNFTYPSPIIGREKELEDLHTHLQGNLPTVVVNGLGGIGKTILAREYIKRHEGLYDHIIWLEQAGKPIDAFVNDVNLRMELGLTFQNETTEQRFEMILHKLKKITSKNLLVLDNYQQDTSEDAYPFLACFPFSKHWHVFFTSREQIAGFTTMELDILSEEEAIALFKMHCTGKDIDDTELKSLLQEIGYHTLLIELLAKIYNTNDDLKNLPALTAKMQQKALHDQDLQDETWTAHSQEEIALYEYLLRIFNIEALDENARYVLKQLAVLPAEAQEYERFLDWIGDETHTHRKTLKELEKKGWLACPEQGYYQMHRLIQMLMLKILQPTYQDCAILHDAIGNFLGSDVVKANPLQAQWLTRYGESLLQHIDYQNNLEKKAYLQNQIAFLYHINGDYAQALPLYEQALQIRKEILGEKHPDTAMSLNNIANIYNRQGKYAKALPLYEQALQIREEMLGEKNPDTAMSLNNIASIYYNQGNYAQALLLFEQALQIRKEVLGEKHADTATSLNNIAGVYDSQNNYAQALPLYEQALQIRQEVLGKKHPDIAQSLNNIAAVYDTQGYYAQALPLYEQALQIHKEVLREKHPHTATSLNNIGMLYFNIQQYDKAKSSIEQAYQIWQEVLGEEHPNTQLAKENLAFIIQKIWKG